MADESRGNHGSRRRLGKRYHWGQQRLFNWIFEHPTGARVMTHRRASRIAVLLLCAAPLCANLALSADTDSNGWTVLFDGKNMDGWKASEHKDSWKFVDGAL